MSPRGVGGEQGDFSLFPVFCLSEEQQLGPHPSDTAERKAMQVVGWSDMFQTAAVTGCTGAQSGGAKRKLDLAVFFLKQIAVWVFLRKQRQNFPHRHRIDDF